MNKDQWIKEALYLMRKFENSHFCINNNPCTCVVCVKARNLIEHPPADLPK